MEIELRSEVFSGMNKAEKYAYAEQVIQGLCEGEHDLTANLANISAVFREIFHWWWCGFYLVKANELVLGPFQGPVACTRIAYGKGVCGQAWSRGETLVVPDVDRFPGHIACSAQSKSEIVVPVIRNQHVVAVFDADSEQPDHFDETDQRCLEEICRSIPGF